MNGNEHNPGAVRRVLAAKLKAPTQPALWLPRLDTHVASLWANGFGTVVAPTGYGKTTFSRRPVAGSPGAPPGFELTRPTTPRRASSRTSAGHFRMRSAGPPSPSALIWIG